MRPVLNKALQEGRKLWRLIPADARRALFAMAQNSGFSPAFPDLTAKASADNITPGPIIISGYFSDTRGVAQVARLAADALRRAGFAVIEHDVTHILRPGATLPEIAAPSGGIWVIYCNPPEARVVLDRHPELAQAPLYRIGAWAWELQTAPADWIRYAARFHEIWTLSAFQAAAFKTASVPVVAMPPCVPVQPPRIRSTPGALVFLHVSDLRSSADRKNPAGALDAYLQAFPEPSGTRLTMKISGANGDQAAYQALKDRVGGRADIDFIERHLTAAEMQALLEEMDVLVSLHRAEGFGLPLAEAMAMGKAVVTTGWSGVLDFLSPPDNPQLAPFTLVPVSDAAGLYTDGVWAEPDIAGAAAIMRRLRDEGGLRDRLGRANREAVAALSDRWSRARLDALPFAPFTEDADGRQTLSRS